VVRVDDLVPLLEIADVDDLLFETDLGRFL